MRSYLSLVSLEAKVHPKQNRLTVFCIALAVFLVTGLFSMADMAVRMENQRLREIHGYWHIMVHDVSEDTIELMKKDAFGVFLTLEDFAEFCRSNQETQQPVYYIRFKDGIGLKHDIQMFQEKYGLTNQNSGTNTAILGIRGISDNSYFIGLYSSASFLAILVIMAGILMITGSMNSNIAERTQFFGMLRCIGTSKKQIMLL